VALYLFVALIAPAPSHMESAMPFFGRLEAGTPPGRQFYRRLGVALRDWHRLACLRLPRCCRFGGKIDQPGVGGNQA